MKTIETLATIISNAKSEIRSEMGSLSFCVRTLKMFAGTLTSVKRWKAAIGIKVEDITPSTVLSGWGKYLIGGTCAVLTPIYKVDEHCNFIYENTTDKNGRIISKKIVDFYVWDAKSKWTVGDCLDAVTRNYSKTYKPEKDLMREVPFVKVNGKLEVSVLPEHERRAKDETRATEDATRAANAAE